RNIRALNGRFNTSITHAYSIVIGSKHITLNATGGGFLTASKQFRNIQTACLIMEGAEFTENIINGVERPVKAAELFAFTLRVRAGNTDVLTDAEENVRQKLRAEGVM